MSVRTTKEYTCDLCAGRSGEVDFFPKGWAKILTENKYVDRDFTDKHICEDCSKEIAKQIS